MLIGIVPGTKESQESSALDSKNLICKSNDFFYELLKNKNRSSIIEEKTFLNEQRQIVGEGTENFYIKQIIKDDSNIWSNNRNTIFTDNHTAPTFTFHATNFFLDKYDKERILYTGDTCGKSLFTESKYLNISLALVQFMHLSYIEFLLSYYNLWLEDKGKDTRFSCVLGNHEESEMFRKDIKQCLPKELSSEKKKQVKGKELLPDTRDIEKIVDNFTSWYRFAIPIQIIIINNDNALWSMTHSGGVSPMLVKSKYPKKKISLSENKEYLSQRVTVSLLIEGSSLMEQFLKSFKSGVTDTFKKVLNLYAKNCSQISLLRGNELYPMETWCDFMEEVCYQGEDLPNSSSGHVFHSINSNRRGEVHNPILFFLCNYYFIYHMLYHIGIEVKKLDDIKKFYYFFGHQHGSAELKRLYNEEKNSFQPIAYVVRALNPEGICHQLCLLPPEAILNSYDLKRTGMQTTQLENREVSCDYDPYIKKYLLYSKKSLSNIFIRKVSLAEIVLSLLFFFYFNLN